jgi:alkylation response protein AidB-like acyl-CoA dehydrogenase
LSASLNYDFLPIGEDDHTRVKADRLLAGIEALAPEITSRAAEIETARRIPPDLLHALKSTGIFRTFVPQSRGGLELDLPAALDIFRAISKIDGSVGWTTAIGSSSGLLASLLPRELYDRVYSNGPDVIFAGSLAPLGTAEPTDGGWRITGRWPFASGCEHADWMMAFCIMTHDGKPITEAGSSGNAPVVRGFLLPAADFTIHDTWHVAGLKGTGSHDITLSDTVVSPSHFFDLAGGTPCVPGPLYRGVRQMLPLTLGAIAIGIAEGALDDVVAMANSGRRQQRAAAPMRDTETFQAELGRAAAEVRAARAFLRAQAESHWQQALAGTLNSEDRFTEGAQTATWVVGTCVRSAAKCFALGGGSALYERSPLQRRLRDLYAAAQHASVHERHYAIAGKLLLESSLRAMNGRPEESIMRSANLQSGDPSFGLNYVDHVSKSQ